MNQYEKEYCLSVMKKLREKHVSSEFFKIIEYPPSKNTRGDEKRKTIEIIYSSLNNDLYTKGDWIKSVRTLFQIVMNEYRENSVIYLIASDLSEWFEKKIKLIPKNAQERWLAEYSKAQKEAEFVLNNIPIKSK